MGMRAFLRLILNWSHVMCMYARFYFIKNVFTAPSPKCKTFSEHRADVCLGCLPAAVSSEQGPLRGGSSATLTPHSQWQQGPCHLPLLYPQQGSNDAKIGTALQTPVLVMSLRKGHRSSMHVFLRWEILTWEKHAETLRHTAYLPGA